MAGKAVPMGQRRPTSNPYLTLQDGPDVVKVLKAYTADPDEKYARWDVEVVGPNTGPLGDRGDQYVSHVRGVITQRDPSIPDTALPRHLRA